MSAVEAPVNGRGPTPDERLNPIAGPLVGSVVRVDANRVDVALADPQMITRITVSDLVAIPTGREFLVGLVELVQGVSSRDFGARQVSPSDRFSDADRARSDTVVRIMPVGTFRPDDNASGSFYRGAGAFPHIGSRCHLIEGDALRFFLLGLGTGVARSHRLVLGHYAGDENAVAVADGNTLFQRHLAILGSTGSGKSWAVALMLERAARLKHANLIVFDAHGEYAPLTRATDDRPPVARALRVAGPADLGRVDRDVLYLPYWLLSRDELLTLVLNQADPDAADQRLRFSEHLQALKAVYLIEAGCEDAVRTFTVDSPIPYKLSHLVQMLRRDDTEKVPQGPSSRLEPGQYFGRLAGLISRIEARIGDPRYGFIFAPPEETLHYEWLTQIASTLLGGSDVVPGIKVIDLSEVPSAVLPMVVAVLARLMFDVQFWMPAAERTPICLVCDEAHLYLPATRAPGSVQDAAVDAFEAIAKEGRKYGVGLMIASQRPSDISRTILSQCNNFIVMRMKNDHDREMIERLLPETLTGVTDALPVLDVGEGVVIGDAVPLPSRVRFDAPDAKPSSATQPYWTMWAEKPSSPAAIVTAVEAFRNQLRTGV